MVIERKETSMKKIGEMIRKIPGMTRMNDVTPENDIRYRGPLSYRYLRIIAWIILLSSQIYFLFVREQYFKGNEFKSGAVTRLILTVSNLVMPLFLIAVFAVILNGRERYKRTMAFYGISAILIIALFFYATEHLAVGVLSQGDGSTRASAREVIRTIMITDQGHLSFNIFVDLFLCVLLMYFINYNPKKHFTGKKIYIFRSFVLIPILYETVSIVLKILSSTGKIDLPMAVFPFLTAKPPMMFLMFIGLAFFVKNRERRYIRAGGTHEEYNTFLKTNVNSLHFSMIFIIAIIICVLLDYLVFKILYSIYTGSLTDDGTLEATLKFVEWRSKIDTWGFGKLTGMLWLTPLMLLFSYTRRHRHIIGDFVIPFVGIISFILIYIEYFYHILCNILNGSIDVSKMFGH